VKNYPGFINDRGAIYESYPLCVIRSKLLQVAKGEHVMVRFNTPVQPAEISPAGLLQAIETSSRRGTTFWLRICLCLILAWVGAGWFAYQYFLVPQPAHFAADWQGAQWVKALDGNSPVAYFRYTTQITALPDAAFVTVAADQLFRLYVNGTFIGSNKDDIAQGNGSFAYIYDVASTLQSGTNVIALRVANIDQCSPAVRASFGIVQGSSITYHGTGTGWLATTQSALVYLQNSAPSTNWSLSTFDASSWQPVEAVTNPPATPLLTVNPLLYEHPLATQWMGIASSHDAYFVRTITKPADSSDVWLRIAATGPATIFINGHPYIAWNGQPTIPRQQIVSYLSEPDDSTPDQQGLLLGMYDLSAYLHTGSNTLAVHVMTPGNSAVRIGSGTLGAALSTDILISDSGQQARWVTPDASWRASSNATTGWELGNTTAPSWSPPLLIGRSGISHTFYLPNIAISRSISQPSFSQIGVVVLLCLCAVSGLWLLAALGVKRRYSRSYKEALGVMCLAYLPALACEGLLVVLSQEPQILQPFPYTWQWGVVLLVLVGAGYTLLWWHRHEDKSLLTRWLSSGREKIADFFSSTAQPSCQKGFILFRRKFGATHISWLRCHWGLLLIMLIALPMSCYGLSYEPYWQDELTSYYAAKGILAHGIPLLPSGFLYPKGELYSYMLALSIAIFGEQQGALRLLSVGEYLISLPIFYGIACSFFHRRIALLATAMLAFSPSALLWGHEVRMYEQAQLLTILTVYLFYRAIQQPQRPGRVYLAVASLLAMYLSHEETFIVLPALVICILLAGWKSSNTTRPLPGVLYEKHWWYAALLGASIIGIQLLLVKLTHPPILGTDQSQQPLIQVTTENIGYYFKLLFASSMLPSPEPWMTLNSLLVLVGGILAIHRRDKPAVYCSLFLLVSMLTLVFLFTLASDRYIYPLLPVFYLMGAYALLNALQALWPLAWTRAVPEQSSEIALLCGEKRMRSLPLRLIVVWTMALICASVLIMPLLPISGYNLFVSRVISWSYHRHYPDYDAAGQYIQQHWRKGDIVIAISPAISVRYYVGHVDYFFSIDRALYLFERNGEITDTPTGSTPLLNQQDFQSVLAAHSRIWIVSDNGAYQAGTMRNGRFALPPDFHIVFEGYGSAVYFRGN
jgi:4-amino-4-deoxy-L-arabinose transferase-like glycosyltransferase